MNWTGSYPDGSGTATINSFTATAAADCQSMTINSNWSYSEPGFSCTGTTTGSGTRTSGGNGFSCGSDSSNSVTESEPNDTADNADVVTVGVPMQATTTSTPPEDDDIYIFTVPTTAKYQFGIDYDQINNSITIVLRDVNLNVLQTSTSLIGSSVDIDAGTVFYIQIDPVTTVGTVPYTLKVNTL